MIRQSKEYYLASRWDVFFGLLSTIEQRIVYTISLESLTLESIAQKCLRDSDGISRLLQDLEQHQVVSSFDGNGAFAAAYFLNDASFQAYCAELSIDRVFDPIEVRRELTEEFYRLAQRRITRISEIGLEISIESIRDGLTQTLLPSKNVTSRFQ